METTKINNREKVGSVAIQQALRFHFKKSIRETAAIVKVSARSVWQNTNSDNYTILKWDERTLKNKAIEQAAKLLA